MSLSSRYKNRPLPKNLCDRWTDDGWPIHSSAMLDRIHHKLGAKSRKLPKDFKGKFNIDGHTVVVFPSRKEPSDKYKDWRTGKPRMVHKKKRISGRKYGLSRVFFLLGRGKLVPVGRIHQSAHCGYRGERRRRR